jgi:hypothetical protein
VAATNSFWAPTAPHMRDSPKKQDVDAPAVTRRMRQFHSTQKHLSLWERSINWKRLEASWVPATMGCRGTLPPSHSRRNSGMCPAAMPLEVAPLSPSERVKQFLGQSWIKFLNLRNLFLSSLNIHGMDKTCYLIFLFNPEE